LILALILAVVLAAVLSLNLSAILDSTGTVVVVIDNGRLRLRKHWNVEWLDHYSLSGVGWDNYGSSNIAAATLGIPS